ncbi:hypothetical protein R1CP_39185 (plasmid) [Rhodococcus opacus]|uniref:Uncharacterized protein n=1 Tax=Rhodococcus opacus TaxID=37919 RepID=A0A1B1KI90_RHOOP|nr:hypothetical protein R1CP_38680 [Rhodococcus opacus]ANS32421.1 hypothetical protein R1CP_39185 [Rhodococcus opacus]
MLLRRRCRSYELQSYAWTYCREGDKAVGPMIVGAMRWAGRFPWERIWRSSPGPKRA